MEQTLDNTERQKHSNVWKTYYVTLIMLIVGILQVVVSMQIEPLKQFLKKYYYVSLLQFFISFLSIQLYVFFYHIIAQKAAWKRVAAGLWTFESNTISVMKPAKEAPNICFAAALACTILMIILSIVYGNIAIPHRRGMFMSRHNVIRWSERLFVLTSFGIIVCSEMSRVTIEFPTMLVYTLMSNIFVVYFAGSIRKPNFYHEESPRDYILIGQLYYLNFYALFMGYVWTFAAGINMYHELNP